LKFKTKEELLSEQNGIKSYGQGLDDAFKSFAERVEFYKKYKDLYYTPSQKIWEKYIKYHTKHLEIGWKDWLFDYCFGDVIE